MGRSERSAATEMSPFAIMSCSANFADVFFHFQRSGQGEGMDHMLLTFSSVAAVAAEVKRMIVLSPTWFEGGGEVS